MSDLPNAPLAAPTTTGDLETPGYWSDNGQENQDWRDLEEVFVFPMSFGQQRLWFLDQFEPGSPYYNIPLAIRLSGPLSADALAASLNEIVRRHEALRTTITTLEGEPVQVIAPRLTIPMPLVDLQHLPLEEREEEARRLAFQEARHGFDLARGPLLRGRLLRLSPQEHLALVTMHHIISDGWSVGVLMRELAALYTVLSQGLPSPLPELPIQYADYAEWQRELLQGEGLERQLAYWRQQLGSQHPVLELPTDRPRPAVRSDRGASCSITLPSSLLQGLHQLSRQEGVTLFMTLLAAFQTLLQRYSGQETISIGTPIANRTRGETEALIGLFINTLVLRSNLAGDPTFRHLLGRVKEVTLGAYAHQDLPFEMLVEALQPERDMSHAPLFQVMFILQNLQGAATRVQAVAGLSMRPIEVDMGTATYDLTLSCSEQGAGLHVAAEYNTDLFDRATIVRLLGHFHHLLAAIVADPDCAISRLPLIPPAELRQMVVDWNATERPFALEQRIHDLFEAQAQRTPDRPAVVVGESRATLSYRQLDRRANQLAHHLQRLGVQPGQPVAICVERSLEMIVGLLGVLKAGGAYVPIDPAYPAERIAFMLHDCAAPILLTQEGVWQELTTREGAGQPFLARFSEQGAAVVLLDSQWPAIAQLPDQRPASAASADTLAYLIYTSGSTGQSKGVMICHRSLVNAYLAWEEAYRLREEATSHLQMAAFSFDVFTGDLVRVLCSGAKLVLCPREWLLLPEQLYALMRREGVDCAEFVPAVLRQLAAYLDESGQRLDFMRLLICGSDSWYAGEYQRFLRFCGPQTRLINSFGLTEATIDSCYFQGAVSDLPQDRMVPIGKPLANQQMVILDRHLQPVPIGVAGELYIGGLGLALGYFNRPDLTAERFIPNPFASVAERLPVTGDRLYKTGDLARYLPDGNVEFLGRLDHQVKIRGFRIEPGEVEAALGQHPNVRQGVVMACQAPGGDQRLAAYIAPRFSPPPTHAELRRFLQERLADYMVPATLVTLAELPLTPNGKVDRQALPPPDWSQRELLEALVAPRTPLEELLAGIFSQVLGVEQVGVHDDFFQLGGHSLLATQLMARVRQVFAIDLPLRHIFESPTVALLAQQVAQAQGAAGRLQPPPITPVPRDQPLLLSFAQQRLWFLDQLEPNSPLYNIPESIRLRGPLEVAAMERALNEVVRRHEALRTSFAVHDDRPVQVIEPHLHLALPVVDLEHLPSEQREAEIQRLATQEAQTPFDLTQPPLLRATLLRLAADDHVILVTTHHIISDNWSSSLLIGEVALAYDAFLHGRPFPLPPLPLQYADFAAWQRAWLEGQVVIDGQVTSPWQQQIDYWQGQLAGLPPLLELPTDRPRPPVQTFRGDYHSFELSEKLSHQLRALSQQEGSTLFMTLLAAFQALLSRYSGQEDFAVGAPIAGRTREEIEGMVGFFVNTLVLRADLTGEPGFRDLLRRVRETALGAYAHQDLPFEMLVERLQPERRLSHSPLFQVMFSLQSGPARQPQVVSDLTLTPVEAHSGTAKFDLTLFMVDAGPRLAGALEFNTDLFDRTTIQRMIGHFQRLLEALVADPDLPISRLPLLSDQERHFLLVEWNATQAEFPEHLLAHQLFEAQAAATPDAVAVVQTGPASARSTSLTYVELASRAHQLAHHLRSLGVETGDIVAICTDRVLELPVAIMGVLKAGAAYLPIDPVYPAERIAYMLEDAGVPVVLTQQRVWEGVTREIGTRAGMQVVYLDADWPDMAQHPAGRSLEWAAQSSVDPSTHPATPADLAYVIYTSGSTGRPKGTLVHHRGLVNYLTWCRRTYPLDRGIGAPVHSSISFDLTVTSLLAPLTAGRTAYLVAESLGVEALTAALRAKGDFSLVKITPAHLELIGHQLRPEEGAGRTAAFIIGGEQLLAEQVAFWQQHAPDTLLVNEYGPTEAVVGCCVYTAEGHTPLRGAVAIGRPIINTQLYVLDRHMNLLPVGVPGELYIGGAGVAYGYLNRPDLTAEKFVPNPFAGEMGVQPVLRSGRGDDLSAGQAGETKNSRLPLSPSLPLSLSGARLYKTGDLVRLRPDGELEFLGRVDDQVKIRGFRIELGEIEAVLAGHPAVRETAVILQELAPDDRRLLAFVAWNADALATPAQLRHFLAQKLPDYMLPAAFVTLEALPLTPNGKVDRQALARLEGVTLEGAAAGPPALAPHTPEEEILAAIFAQILHLSHVDAHANFFDLGGHSLLATQVISRLRDAFGVELPLRAIFEAPSPASLAQQVAAARRAAQGVLPPPIQPADRSDPLPLSFAQQRLWFLDQLEPGSPLYNIPAAVRLTGPLNLPVLEQSLNEVVRRHEALRTTFVSVNGKPTQLIHPELPLALSVADLRRLPEEDREAEAERQAAQAAMEPFDLAQGPLLRAHLWRLGDEDYLCLLNTHHIISDDWSLGMLVSELTSLFAHLVVEEPPSLTAAPLAERAGLRPLPVQYADYAVWQRNWLQGEVLARQVAYWRAKLAGLPPLLELPTDRPRPPIQTARGGQRTFTVPADLAEELKTVARASGATLFMALLAAFQALLSRYSGQDDIAVGTPIANRTHSEIEGLIGFFVNTLVMRADLTGRPTFRTLLSQVRETALQAYAHQDVPFETLVDALKPVRDLSHSPLFQVMFVLQNAPRRAQTLETGLTLSTAGGGGTVAARFDLTLTMVEDGTGLSGSFEYNADLFDAATIERMADHLVALLRGAVAEPDRAIADLPILSDAERQQLLVAWNDTAVEWPAPSTVHRCFEAQAALTPTAPAILFAGAEAGLPDRLLTYGELDARANQLAHHLRSLGVGPETAPALGDGANVVALSVERSPEMIIGMLGILKAGGAYLPIDPNYPADRIRFMLTDSGAQVLLTQQDLLKGRLPDPSAFAIRHALCLDADWPEIANTPRPTAEPIDQPSVFQATDLLTPASLAYVIYTSGSTGWPKGALLHHRGLYNLVRAQTEALEITAEDRVLQFASFSFDASVSETFMALTTGATLVLAPQSVLTSPPDLLTLLRQRAITAVTLPPSLLKVLEPEGLSELRTIISAGERCTPEAIARWLPGRRVFNAYGPTEATIGPTLGQVRHLAEDATNVPIGRPIANTQIYLLDRMGQPVPVGVPGELYVGGVGVGRGYHGRPDLTAERFVPNPFADKASTPGDQEMEGSFSPSPPPPASRLYKTGDLARWLPDGQIEYLRRIDQQVKVRGFRIELGEIEATLARHPELTQAAVIVREDEPGQSRLVAYVVPGQEPAPTVTELRSFLLASLPDYMVPAAFVNLDSLPLTPNGKVDRRALPAPEGTRPDLAAVYVAPRTPIEEKLAAIWAQVLGVAQVGIHDNFFELGGDSIISIQVIAQANQAGLQLTPKDLFIHPTVAELAELAAHAAPAEETSPTQPSGDAAADFGWSQDDVDDILAVLEDL